MSIVAALARLLRRGSESVSNDDDGDRKKPDHEFVTEDSRHDGEQRHGHGQGRQHTRASQAGSDQAGETGLAHSQYLNFWKAFPMILSILPLNLFDAFALNATFDMYAPSPPLIKPCRAASA